MKSATLPPLRVEPEFRDELETVLAEGETVSAFIEKSLRESVQRRKTQAEFIKRGMESLARVKAGERTYTTEEVVAELRAMTAAARQRQAQERAEK